jgi:GR25 family glycosyltransferase involved in LPS biosynthesis
MSSWLAKTHTKRFFAKQNYNNIYINNIDNKDNTNQISHIEENNIKHVNISNKLAIDYIDAILYINLEHRKDRNEHCLNEIKKIDPYLSKVHRINAVYNKDNGALGCSLSHINALTLFIKNSSWNNCLILEDDFTFISQNSFEINNNLVYLFENCDNFDVLLLAIGKDNLEYKQYKDHIHKIYSAQTASGYVVNKKYAYTLLANYTTSSNNMKVNGWKSEWCLDQYWKKIMPFSNWYSFKNRIGFQYNNYSDIECKNIDYGC